MQTKESIEATCPDCRGPLSLIRTDELLEIRGTVGHAYSPRTLLQAHAEAQERALWAAAVALTETAAIVNSLGTELPPSVIDRLREQTEKKQQQAAIIQSMIEDLEPFEV